MSRAAPHYRCSSTVDAKRLPNHTPGYHAVTSLDLRIHTSSIARISLRLTRTRIPYPSGAWVWDGVEHGSRPTPNVVPYTLAYRRASGRVTEGVG